MREGGYFERRTRSPTGLALVILGHAAALGALALARPDLVVDPITRIRARHIPLPPSPDPPEPKAQPRPRDPISVVDRTRPVIPPLPGPIADNRPPSTIPSGPTAGTDPVPDLRPDPVPPVRRPAEFDPRFAAALQPPYPPDELRAQRDGRVRIRLAIGADGRVSAIARLSATSEAFWEATRRHALARWRFRPATEDGRPVASVKTMNLVFRIADL